MTVFILLLGTINDYGDYTNVWVDSVWSTKNLAKKRLDSISPFTFHIYKIEEKKIGAGKDD